jgi:type I restriction enzyme S subunit
MNETSSLPKSWAWTTIGEVVEVAIEQGSPIGRSDFLYVDISSIDTKTKKISEPKTLPTSKAPTRAKQHLKPRDVVVSMTRPNLNGVAMVPQEMFTAIASTGFCVLRPIDTAPALMFYLVQAESFVSAMSLLVQGALYPAVRPKDILAYKFPLPPLAEQHRIVAKIEELFTKLDAGVQELRRAKAQLKRYRQSVLKAAVTGQPNSLIGRESAGRRSG